MRRRRSQRNHWATTGLKKGIGSEGGDLSQRCSPLFISLPRHCCLPSFPHPPPPFSLVFVASAAAAASLALARKGREKRKSLSPSLSVRLFSAAAFSLSQPGKRERRRKLFLQVPSPTHLVPRRGFAAVEALTFIGFDWERRRRKKKKKTKTRRIIIPLLRPVRGLF